MRLFLLTMAALICSCASTRVQLNAGWHSGERPAYEDYVDYYLFGLVGRPTLDLQKICVDQKPYALQSQRSVEDGFITLVTLGIYSPMTVRVWCGD